MAFVTFPFHGWHCIYRYSMSGFLMNLVCWSSTCGTITTSSLDDPYIPTLIVRGRRHADSLCPQEWGKAALIVH